MNYEVKKKSHRWYSNPRPMLYESIALPAELRRHLMQLSRQPPCFSAFTGFCERIIPSVLGSAKLIKARQCSLGLADVRGLLPVMAEKRSLHFWVIRTFVGAGLAGLC